MQAKDVITGQVLKGVAYYTKTKAGEEHKGYTDDEGYMPRIKIIKNVRLSCD